MNYLKIIEQNKNENFESNLNIPREQFSAMTLVVSKNSTSQNNKWQVAKCFVKTFRAMVPLLWFLETELCSKRTIVKHSSFSNRILISGYVGTLLVDFANEE